MVIKKRGVMAGLGLVVVLAVAAGIAWFGPWRDDAGSDRPGVDEGDPAAVAADAFAEAWSTGTLDEAPTTESSGNVAGSTALITGGLTSADSDLPTVEITKVERTAGDDTGATATATITWQLDGERAWSYTTYIPLVDSGGERGWEVAWRPAVIEPRLKDGDALQVSRVVAPRGQILDRSGAVLSGAKGNVIIGIQKSRTPDVDNTVQTVALLTGVDPAALAEQVAGASPDAFVEVTTMPWGDYEKIRAEIQPLPGTVFREEEGASTVPPDFASSVLGATATADEEAALNSEGRVQVGDLVGVSGIQASQDERLAGLPGMSVQAVAEGAEPRVLKDFPAVPGESITVTLDPSIQMAADAAVADTANPSALVAIQVSTGDVLAVANGPTSASEFNRAMLGKYPPGSVFKVPTTLGLFQNGLTPDEVVDCPATVVVGKEFRNAEGEALGPVPFREDFAHSCNTAFVSQADRISATELTQVAASLGYRELDMEVPVFGASVPSDGDVTEHAAQMIGQGRVEASPFAVALSSASVAAGRSLEPRLVVDPESSEPAAGEPLPEAAVVPLREVMRQAVVDGTGGAVAFVPGGEVFAKTGTAEFGTETPPRTHAWFTGFQGDIAFAVLVEDGGFGGSVAAPIAARFLTDIAG